MAKPVRTKVLSATAERQTLILSYRDESTALGCDCPCTCEYDLPEYTADRPVRGGKRAFAHISSAAWRSICCDLLTVKTSRLIVDQIYTCIFRYASAYAVQIFRAEFEKYVRRAIKARPVPPKPEALEEEVQRSLLRFDAIRRHHAAVSLDMFPRHLVSYTPDMFAAANGAR